jgi:hypothetical protein
MDCVALKKGFNQVCVWPGKFVGAENVEDFEQFMLDEFGIRVQYLEEIYIIPGKRFTQTAASKKDGRCELFFAVQDADVTKFAISRLKTDIRWAEDVLSKINRQSKFYPEYVKLYRTWYYTELSSPYSFDSQTCDNQ